MQAWQPKIPQIFRELKNLNYSPMKHSKVKKLCPNGPDAAKKLKECEKAVMKLKFEEAISLPQSKDIRS
ncbi:hypothetical protein RD792_007154 [Penstemon davidsonii]|uniref:Uncharacterized protein n=1 Tax=Penstemon davidsonii TaxID=160366 RepID=A0ABR0D6B3_9LAMI|nr:hypothetical protein RD792_007154 [Penstemon davidsonii]